MIKIAFTLEEIEAMRIFVDSLKNQPRLHCINKLRNCLISVYLHWLYFCFCNGFNAVYTLQILDEQLFSTIFPYDWMMCQSSLENFDSADVATFENIIIRKLIPSMFVFLFIFFSDLGFKRFFKGWWQIPTMMYSRQFSLRKYVVRAGKVLSVNDD